MTVIHPTTEADIDKIVELIDKMIVELESIGEFKTVGKPAAHQTLHREVILFTFLIMFPLRIKILNV